VSEIALQGAELALGSFRHEAFLYDGMAAFLGGTVPFVQAGLDADEAVLVVVGAEKIGGMREALGPDATRVSFADMAEVGRNPARIIPAWRDFLAEHGHRRPVRGIGEPVWAGRTPDELIECQRHEALLNVAFATGAPWRLLCPYDSRALGADVLQEARHSHRLVTSGGRPEECDDYQGDTWTGPGDDRLPDPPAGASQLAFGPGPLEPVRAFVVEHVGTSLGASELIDLLLAVTEVASNSVVHGGGAGTLRVWPGAEGAVCEVRDQGRIREPLVGRARPPFDRESGRGLWMVNQLCDLVQLRSSPAGTVVRMHMQARTAPVTPPG
jgi:anti-sigma regulatory factor (Ser/Thr protein kinase)